MGMVVDLPAVDERSDTAVFAERESAVRSYIRSWPTIFETARGSSMYDTAGREYLDFFAGAGALNYGHNNPQLKRELLDYIVQDHITHSLDMATTAKAAFLNTFCTVILEPRGLNYRVMFPGPTGTNAVEAALKIARLATGRLDVVHFANSFHGMTLGSLAVTSNGDKRAGAGVPLTNAIPASFDAAGLDFLRQLFYTACSGGASLPAAVIVETVQGEGGINVAEVSWLRHLRELCSAHGVMLIIDDVQMGCGRTGSFFSFEASGIVPDIVTLSKSISGYGLPMALVLVKPDLDVFSPGQHNGTFRGNNTAFVTATAAINTYWRTDEFADSVLRKSRTLERYLRAGLEGVREVQDIRGRGLAQGVVCVDESTATRTAHRAFQSGLLVETCGPEGNVIKLLPPLTTSETDIRRGVDLLVTAFTDDGEFS